jgi:hypothetical protein
VTVSELGKGVFDLARERLERSSLAFGVVISIVGVTVVSALERRSDPSWASDHALSGAAFGIALPLLALAVVRRLCDEQRLDAAVDVFARHGANRRRAVLYLLASATAVLALAGLLLVVAALAVAHPSGSNGFWADTATSSWIMLLAAWAYAACLAVGSSFGKRGGGRFWFLGLDWVLGSGSAFAAVPWPRGHIRNLLGAEPVLDWSQGTALACLLVLAVTATLVAALRLPP